MRKHERVNQELEKRQKILEESDRFLERLKSLSGRVSVVLVEPKYQGNIGAVARSMMNAGLSTMYVVGGNGFDNDAYIRAIYGKKILDNSIHVDSLDEITDRFDVIAATSSATSMNERKFRRIPVSPDNFWKSLLPTGRKIALVFGREDDGLRNTEVEKCNYFIHIPSSPEYPAYNLSHAVAIVLYEMIKMMSGPIGSHDISASSNSISLLEDEVEELLELSEYSSYRMKNTMVMLRRIIARSNLTDLEYHKLRGIIDSLQRKMNSVPEGMPESGRKDNGKE